MTGLMKFMEYSVYVQASTAAGIGDRSDTVNVFTDEDSESTQLGFSECTCSCHLVPDHIILMA